MLLFEETYGTLKGNGDYKYFEKYYAKLIESSYYVCYIVCLTQPPL